MKLFHRLWVLGLVVVVVAGIAYAGFSNPSEAVAYRKAVMQVIGYHFKSMGAVVQGKADYDKVVFQRDASVVAAVAGSAWSDSLAEGSAAGDTRLKAPALTDKAGYLAISRDFEGAAMKLSAAAKAGGLNSAKAAFGEAAKSCKACHGAYRK